MDNPSLDEAIALPKVTETPAQKLLVWLRFRQAVAERAPDAQIPGFLYTFGQIADILEPLAALRAQSGDTLVPDALTKVKSERDAALAAMLFLDRVRWTAGSDCPYCKRIEHRKDCEIIALSAVAGKI